MSNTTVRLAVTPVDDVWRVDYLTVDGGAAAPSRTLRRIGGAPWTFPLPPSGEVALLDAADPHRPLCDSADGEVLIDTLVALQAREPKTPATVTMGRYLFAVLLGDAWPTLRASLGASKALRLEMQWPASDAVFGRLPWEMLHDGEGFLALRDGVTLLRRVEGPATTVAAATTPLDVLFVVGQALRGDVIRPAAEYLALVQNLQSLDLTQYLRPRLLLEASSESLEVALAERRPAVVHFMTHGHYEAKNPYLQMCSPSSGSSAPLTAARLLELLKDGEAPLPIVVLSACETASSRERVEQGDTAAPFAAQLVAGGVPVAVGMTGRVSDQACRLFARTFYSALLSGNDVVEATAAGRQAAFKHGDHDPEVSYDWALPTLLLSSSLASPRLTVQEAPLAAGRRRLAHLLLTPDLHPAFCGRWPILAAGETLMADAAVQRRRLRGGERQVLTLSTASDALEDPGVDRFGRTWALRALASRAALDGHVPCIVSSSYLTPTKGPPGDWQAFVKLLRRSMERTVIELGVGRHAFCEVMEFVLGGPKPADLPDELARVVPSADEPDSEHMARALRHDLLRLLQAVRAQLPTEQRPNCRLLLLIDDLHRLGDVAANILDDCLGSIGLRQCRQDVRLAFTWARGGLPYQPTIRRIVDWLGSTSTEDLPLDRFQDLDATLAYRHFLLHYRPQGRSQPLALVQKTDANGAFVDAFLDTFGEKVEGVPSRLEQVDDIILSFRRLPIQVLVEARDEDVVQRWLDAGGPPS